ncbi:hypothetical protein PR048_019827 [Dryococelus australis]|uniref:Epsilon-sarcoglycan n=1 Tax=Dryococelus australis TaxID=614101 RepID=A0ABQ9H4K8_9NEOP|nr:hypothetical protein PR048_019827 [Dryococelus australis]
MCIIFLIVIILHVHVSVSENVHMTKVFILPIEPEIFNWTEKAWIEKMVAYIANCLFNARVSSHAATMLIGNDQYSYLPSLHNAPELPSWMQYTYSKRHHIGLLYGVPPMNHGDVVLEIVGLDHKSYETRQRVIHINVHKKEDPAKYEVQLKIHNLNVEDMFDSHRLDRLLNVFRKKLWTESDEDLYVTFLASAVQLGGRLPLRPSEEEGIVMRIGSTAPFSSLLIELQEEVRPLWKRGSCPRDFKRTTVEWLFRDAGLALDWCAFRLIEGSSSSGLTHSSHQESGFPRGQGLPRLAEDDRWSRPAKTQLPRRSYVGEFVFTIAVPMLVMVLLVLLLSFILCFHHEGIDWEAQLVPISSVSYLRHRSSRVSPNCVTFMLCNVKNILQKTTEISVVADQRSYLTGNLATVPGVTAHPSSGMRNNCILE